MNKLIRILGDAGADPEVLVGARVECAKGRYPSHRGKDLGRGPSLEKLFFAWNGVLVPKIVKHDKSGKTICISVPSVQILGDSSSVPMIYARDSAKQGPTNLEVSSSEKQLFWLFWTIFLHHRVKGKGWLHTVWNRAPTFLNPWWPDGSVEALKATY